MNLKKIMFYLFGVISVFFSGCETMDRLGVAKPTAQIKTLEFEDVKLNSATLLFGIEVDNPYSLALPLTNLDYKLSSGGSQFLDGDAELQTIIPAKSKKTVSLPVNINYLDMLKTLKGISSAKIPYKADIGLHVETPVLGEIRLPIKKEGEIVLPKVSDIKLNPDFPNKFVQ
ncbi:MAG TPA: LEA type 2 family protein [Sedimentisphaerales bacterium]|nr:LEA type 2 family protein [Sedimentisphaerales bacterium]